MHSMNIILVVLVISPTLTGASLAHEIGGDITFNKEPPTIASKAVRATQAVSVPTTIIEKHKRGFPLDAQTESGQGNPGPPRLLDTSSSRSGASNASVELDTPTVDHNVPFYIFPDSQHVESNPSSSHAPPSDVASTDRSASPYDAKPTVTEGIAELPHTTTEAASRPALSPLGASPSLPPAPPPPPKLSTYFVMVTEPPITRTILDITTVTQAVTVTVPLPPPPPSPTPASNKDNEWHTPPDFDSLDCFNILKYGFGKSNLKVVQGIPASASVTAFAPVPTGASEWSNEMSALEAFYPEGSVNPGNSPQGGADFYANPLPALTRAQNVTFGYSVFVPLDFEPVRGGKLPGLYGGKTGCSGGDAALDCFSTRLMWRPNSEGELYLYAPKDKQTPEVCNTPPRSICEADYGLSIGRGSFRFTPGQWTHVSQTVVLNNPGMQDGYFTLDVNGKRVMDLSGLYYRQNGAEGWNDDGDQGENDEDGDVNSAEVDDATSPNGEGTSGQGAEAPDQNDSEGEGLLGHILVAPPKIPTPPIFNYSRLDVWNAPGRQPVFLAPNPYLRHAVRRANVPPVRPEVLIITKMMRPATVTVMSQITKTQFKTVTQAQATGRPGELGINNLSTTGKVPGFSGIFFSTFFGGHTPNFATPKDQRIWFKDFSLVVND